MVYQTRLLGLLALALVGAMAASACSSWSTELAVVPGTPRPAQAVKLERVATPAPTARAAAKQSDEPRGDIGGSEDAGPTVIRLDPRPAPGPFEMNTYQQGDFVHQAHKDWCVAGSALTMINIMEDGRPKNTSQMQQRIYERGRELSPYKGRLSDIGVDLIGWAELLNNRGFGPYEVAGADTLRKAVRRAAKAIRQTGRPVGLVTWRGAHSWVMSGFTATADPAYDGGFNVEAVHIQDTWYPWVSTIWGASRPPNTLVPVSKLDEDYLPYKRPNGKWPRRDGKYMLILPVLPEGTVAR